jgi:hypothetical protein
MQNAGFENPITHEVTTTQVLSCGGPESVEVISKTESDQAFKNLAEQIGSIDKRLAALDTKVTDLVTSLRTTLDKLPQRLLSEPAKKELTGAVLAALRPELTQLRTDLQKQIDDLTKP